MVVGIIAHAMTLAGETDDAKNSELTPCRRNTSFHAALRVFAIFTLTLCSTWFVMTLAVTHAGAERCSRVFQEHSRDDTPAAPTNRPAPRCPRISHCGSCPH